MLMIEDSLLSEIAINVLICCIPGREFYPTISQYESFHLVSTRHFLSGILALYCEQAPLPALPENVRISKMNRTSMQRMLALRCLAVAVRYRDDPVTLLQLLRYVADALDVTEHTNNKIENYDRKASKLGESVLLTLYAAGEVFCVWPPNQSISLENKLLSANWNIKYNLTHCYPPLEENKRLSSLQELLAGLGENIERRGMYADSITQARLEFIAAYALKILMQREEDNYRP